MDLSLTLTLKSEDSLKDDVISVSLLPFILVPLNRVPRSALAPAPEPGLTLYLFTSEPRNELTLENAYYNVIRPTLERTST